METIYLLTFCYIYLQMKLDYFLYIFSSVYHTSPSVVMKYEIVWFFKKPTDIERGHQLMNDTGLIY